MDKRLEDRLRMEVNPEGKNFFKLGCNFDPAFVSMCDELNNKYDKGAKIIEMYGSDRAHAALSARPDFRLQDISLDYLEKTIQDGLDKGITFNYTMNSIQPYGSKMDMLAHKKEIQDFVKYLESIGCYRITIANPMLALIIREVSNIELELSTVAHCDTISQIKLYKDMLGINKICGNILRNRDKEFLVNAAKYCWEKSIIYEMMINEFCYNTVDQTSSHCILRDSCYLCHATNKTKEDATAYNNYPMGYCMASRGNTEAGWLRSRYVLPQWLKKYNELGIHHFKLTGRTGSIEYLRAMAEAYMSMNYEGNLIELWKPLQSIYTGKSESEESEKYINIPCSKLGDKFIDHWLGDKPFKCDDHVCGEGAIGDPTYDNTDGVWHGQYHCDFCKRYYDKYVKE